MNIVTNKKCILILLSVLCIYLNVHAQNVDSSNFTEDYVKFTKDQKQFNDWSVSIYGGVPWLITADFTSVDNGASTKW